MKESSHYRELMQDFGEIANAPKRIGLQEGVDFVDASILEAITLKPNTAQHYICELEEELGDGTKVFIDIHHLRNVGISKIFPTIIRMIEKSPSGKQVDIYSIDNQGNCLVHTNKNYRSGTEVETRDTNLGRLVPYEDGILAAPKLSMWPRFRLLSAFEKYKQ